MFDVEGEKRGRINIYKAKCISEESSNHFELI